MKPEQSVIQTIRKEEKEKEDIKFPELSDNEQDVKNRVVDFMNRAKLERGNVDKKWPLLEAQYLFFSDWSNIDSFEWRAQGFSVPITFAQVETALAATIGQVPGVRFVPNSQKHFEWVKFEEDAYQYDARRSGMAYEFYLMKKDACKIGLGVGKRIFEEKKRSVKIPKDVKKDENGEEVIEYEEETRTEYSGATLRRFSYWNFFPDPASKRWDLLDCHRGADIEIIQIDAFKEYYGKRPGFKRVDEVLPGGMISASNSGQSTTDETATSGGSVDLDPYWKRPTYLQDDEVEVVHFYDEIKDEYIAVANGLPVRIGPIPWDHKRIPYVTIPFVPVDGDHFWPIGLVEILANPQKHLDLLRKLGLDQTKLSTVKPAAYNVVEEFNTSLLNLEPGVAYPVKGNPRENFSVIDMGSPSPAYYQEVTLMKEEMAMATGIGDQLFGVNPSKGKTTAFEAALVQENSLRRLAPWVRLLAIGLERDAKLWWWLAKQYYTDPIKWERIAGMPAKAIYREIVIQNAAGSFDYKEWDDKYIEMDEPEVIIQAESLLPLSQTLERDEAMQLYGLLKEFTLAENPDKPGSMLVSIAVLLDKTLAKFKTSLSEYQEVSKEPFSPVSKEAIDEGIQDMKRIYKGEDVESTILRPKDEASLDHIAAEIRFMERVSGQVSEAIIVKMAKHIHGEYELMGSAGEPVVTPAVPGVTPPKLPIGNKVKEVMGKIFPRMGGSAQAVVDQSQASNANRPGGGNV